MSMFKKQNGFFNFHHSATEIKWENKFKKGECFYGIDSLRHLKYKWTTWLYNYVKEETMPLEKDQQVVSNQNQVPL